MVAWIAGFGAWNLQSGKGHSARLERLPDRFIADPQPGTLNLESGKKITVNSLLMT